MVFEGKQRRKVHCIQHCTRQDNSRQDESKTRQLLRGSPLECCGLISLIELLALPTKKSEMYWPLYHCNIHALLGPGHTSNCHPTFILLGINSINSWKCSSEIWAHIDVAVSHSCCRFISCHSPMSSHFKDPLWFLD